MRVVTLSPGAAELVEALGRGDAIVARHDAVTRSALARAPETEPAAVARQVADALGDRAPVITVDEDRVAELSPDLVVTGAPGVCGVTAPDALALAGRTVEDALDDLRRLGDALDASDRAAALVDELSRRLDALAQTEVAVVALCWGDPPRLVSGLDAELIARTGARHALGVEDRIADGRELVAADAAHLLYLPCGYTLEQSVTEARALAGWPEARAVPAVARGDFWALAAPRTIVSGVSMAEAVAAALAGERTAATRVSGA